MGRRGIRRGGRRTSLVISQGRQINVISDEVLRHRRLRRLAGSGAIGLRIYQSTPRSESSPASIWPHGGGFLDWKPRTRYATDLLEVCDALALKSAILVGHSAGAMVCALAALRRPSLVSRLVMISASPRYIDDVSCRGGFTRQDVDALYKQVMGFSPCCVRSCSSTTGRTCPG